MQSTLLGIAIAMIAALVAALAGPLFVDWGRYRATFEAEASRIVGQPVRIGGAIDVRLLPTPSLLVRRVEVGPTGAPGFSANAAGFDLALGALMRGQLRAVSARLDGPRLTLALDAAGKLKGIASLANLDADQVAIDQLDVVDGRVALTEAASGKRIELEKLSFVGEVRGVGGPIKGQGAFNAGGKSFSYRLAASRNDEHATKIRLGIDAADRPLTVETDLNLSFDDGVPHYDGALTFARIAGMALTSGKTVASDPWRISGRIKGDSKAALIEQIDMRYGPEERALKLAGTADIAFGAAPRVDAVLSARQIDLDRAVANADAASRTAGAVLRGLGASFGAMWVAPISLNVGIGIETLTLGGATLQAVRGDFKASGGVWSVDNFEFRAPGGTQIKLSGRIDGAPQAPQFAGPISIESINPQALMSWVNGGVDGLRTIIGPLRLRGDLAAGPQQVVLDRIAADYARKAFNGRLAYVFAADGRPARLDAALNAAEFDLDGMRAILAPALSRRQFDWPGEFAVALNFGRATLAGLEAKDLRADLRWDAAGLRIERLAIAEFGGTALSASGQIDMLAVPPRGSVSLSLDAQRLDGVAALMANFFPAAADIVRRSATRLAPAKIAASVRVDPPPAAAGGMKNVGKLTVSGSLGGIQVNATGEAGGALESWPDGYVRLEGRLSSADGTLLSVLGLERMGAPSRPAELTFNGAGPAGGDLRVNARLAGGGLDATVAGSVRLGSDDVKGNVDLAVSASNVRAVRPDGQPFPVAVKSPVTVGGGSVSFTDLTGTAAGASVRGKLALTLDPPHIEGKLATEQLDIPAALAAVIGMPPPADANSSAWSTLPFAAGLFAGIDARLDFDAAEAAVAPGIVARNMHGVARFKPAEITFDNVTGTVGNGSLAGWARFRAAANRLSAGGRIAINNADAATVVPSSSSPLVGRLSSQIEIEGEGSTPAALIGALRGKGSLTLEGVQITGVDPKAFEVVSRAVERGIPITPGRIGDIVDRVMETGSLHVSWASAPVEIAAGRIRLGKLVRPPQGDDLALSGSIDLVERTLDARMTIFGPVSAADTSARPEISVAVKGPLGAPQRAVDVTTLIGWLTLQSVDRASKRLEAVERRAKSADNTNSPAREEQPRSTSSISSEEAAAPRRTPLSAAPRYGTASTPPIPLPPSR